MNFLKNYGGIVLIFLGAAMLVVLCLIHFTMVNALLLLPLLLIVAGIVWHVLRLKRQSNY
jgi:hypothetical protein